MKFARGEITSITASEAENVFRIDDYITGDARSKRIDRLLNEFSEDDGIKPFLDHVAHMLRNPR